MDKFAYIAMSGAKETMLAQAKIANNLANAKTTGFKADLSGARAMPAFGDGLASRVFALTERPGSDLHQGPMIETGNPLDIAIKGQGWFVVQTADGSSALSRNGNLSIAGSGLLQTETGRPILGDNGPIVVPPIESISIGEDGTVSIRPLGAPGNSIQILDRLRLVKPDNRDLIKRSDGLFDLKTGRIGASDATVAVRSEMLEGSNVDTVGALTRLVELSRRFELQIKLLASAQQNDEALDRFMQG